LAFYTYLWLREDGTPSYAGKGKGKRAFRRGSPPPDRIILQEFESEEDAFTAERFLISFYGRKNNGTGCLRNLTDGGEGPAGMLVSKETRRKNALAGLGRKHSPKTKAKMRAARLGWKPSPSTIEKFRRMNLGRKHTEEWKEQMRIANRGDKNPFFGHTHSSETREKLSQVLSGRTPWNKGKPFSEEARAKMSFAKKGKPWTDARRRAM
jgi:hypothetical protein